MKKKLKSNGGFTLIEVIVALAIIGIIAMLIIPLFSNSYVHIDSSGEKSAALYEGQQYLEQISAGEALPDEVTTEQANQSLVITINGLNINVTGDLLKVGVGYGPDAETAEIYYFKVK